MRLEDEKPWTNGLFMTACVALVVIVALMVQGCGVIDPHSESEVADRDRVTPGGRFVAEQLASGGRWRLTFVDNSEGPFDSVRLRIEKDSVVFARLTWRRGDPNWSQDVGPAEVPEHDWELAQMLLDANGNAQMDEEKDYPLVVLK